MKDRIPDRVVRPPVDREVDEELSFHVEMRVRRLVAEGMGEDEARREALRMAGDLERTRARMRHEGKRRERRMKRRDGWDGLLQDVRFGWRQLRRAPAFGWVAMLTLGLAIGANTAVFSVVKGVLLEPLPYDRPEAVVTLWTRYLPPSGFDIPRFALSGPEILDLRDEVETFERTGVYLPGSSRTLTGDGGEAERLSVTLVSADVVPLLGARPLVGRTFTVEDDLPGAAPVALLSHELWTSRFGQDPEIVGGTILLNGTRTEVVGVMPPEFTFGAGAQAWLPVGLDRSNSGGRAGHGYFGVARLAAGATVADVEAELDLVADRWASEYEHNVAHYAWAEPIRDTVLGDAPRTLLLLQVAVGLVMLIACANVANLLLARGARRSGEIALRAVLGAGRGRIIRQLVTEAAVLSGAAALLGVALAWWATPALIGIAPSALPRVERVGLDASVLLFTAGVAAFTVLLFGVLSTSMAGRRAVAGTASSSARSAGSRGGGRLRRILVGGEVALSLVVVLLAGLLLRSYAARSAEDRGLDATNLLTFSLTLPEADYPDGALVPAGFRAVIDGLTAIPGVAAASATNTLPFDGGYGQWDFQLDDRPPREDGDRAWNAGVAAVAPGYFETLGIPVLEGRGIEEADDGDAPWVGVVSETFAETYWPGESPLGKRWGYQQTEDSTTWITVVGVAGDPVMRALGEEPYPFVWMPHAQAGQSGYFWPRTLRLAVRTAVRPESLVPAVRETVRAFDPDLPVYGVRTMEDAVSDSLAEPRLATSLLGIFALLALVLAGVGVYGVIAYSVAGRTREIGVRVALGADRGRVIRLVLADGMGPVAVGIGVGLVGAWTATGLVRSMLFGVQPNDALTFVGVPLALLAVAGMATWLPARRATAIAPTEALREE